MTASTMLFFQHEELDRINEDTQQREKGENDPKIVFMIPATLIYLFMMTPRIIANGFVWAVTPPIFYLTIFLEFLFSMIISHCLFKDLRDNQVVPGGFLLALTNTICPTAPIGKVWLINGISTMYTILKLVCVYVSAGNYSDFKGLFIDVCGQPDLFRCFDQHDISNSSCNDSFNIFRPCCTLDGEFGGDP